MKKKGSPKRSGPVRFFFVGSEPFGPHQLHSRGAAVMYFRPFHKRIKTFIRWASFFAGVSGPINYTDDYTVKCFGAFRFRNSSKMTAIETALMGKQATWVHKMTTNVGTEWPKTGGILL